MLQDIHNPNVIHTQLLMQDAEHVSSCSHVTPSDCEKRLPRLPAPRILRKIVSNLI